MKILPDSNALYGDDVKPWLDVPSWFVLRQSLERLGHSVHIPKVVIEEMIRRYGDNLRSESKRTREALGRLAKLLAWRLDDPLPKARVAEFISHYRNWLQDQTRDFVADYPRTTHEAVVVRDLSRRRPFDQEGKGYRDTLIWETVLELASRDNMPVALVTKDKDFVDRDRTLHADLQSDMRELGLEVGLVRVFATISEFVKEIVVPSLEELAELETALLEGRYPHLDLRNWFEAEFDTLFAHRDWYSWDLGLSSLYHEVGLASFNRNVAILNVEVRRVPSGELLIAFEPLFDCEFDFYIRKMDEDILAGLPTPDSPRILETYPTGDWYDYAVKVSKAVRVHAVVNVLYDETAHRVVSTEVTHVSVAP